MRNKKEFYVAKESHKTELVKIKRFCEMNANGPWNERTVFPEKRNFSFVPTAANFIDRIEREKQISSARTVSIELEHWRRKERIAGSTKFYI